MFGIFCKGAEFWVFPVGAKVTTEGYMKATDGKPCKVASIIIREDPDTFRVGVFYRIGNAGDCMTQAPYVVAEKYVKEVQP